MENKSPEQILKSRLAQLFFLSFPPQKDENEVEDQNFSSLKLTPLACFYDAKPGPWLDRPDT